MLPYLTTPPKNLPLFKELADELIARLHQSFNKKVVNIQALNDPNLFSKICSTLTKAEWFDLEGFLLIIIPYLTTIDPSISPDDLLTYNVILELASNIKRNPSYLLPQGNDALDDFENQT